MSSARPGRIAGASLLSLLALTTAGCGATPAASSEAPEATGEAITVTDQRGADVTLDAPAEHIASAVIPAPAIIAAVDGSWDRIAGINQSLLDANKLGIISRIFPESVETPVIAGRDFVPNMEQILSLSPDLVVQWGDMGADVIAPIEQAGLPVVGLEYGTQEDLETWLTLFGDAIGKPDRAAEIVEGMHASADEVAEKVAALDAPAPRGLSLSYTEEGMKASTGTDYAQYVFDLTGVENVAEDVAGQSAVVSPEQIIEWDPEFIVLSAFDPATPEEVMADPQLAGVSAIEDKRVYRAPLGVYRWQVPSAESPLFWNWIAALAYPGEYDVDLPALMTEQISHLYDYELTREDIDLVLRTDLNADSADYGAVAE
ncbi:ABC transporter substrate-binding protein [Microbacterium rhizophilus]|uniref:ABC transporter substrate-binding protein n=1 Tax=Microbacterium rhizophilus TaxID=3138934 RepID=UPI0031E7192F